MPSGKYFNSGKFEYGITQENPTMFKYVLVETDLTGSDHRYLNLLTGFVPDDKDATLFNSPEEAYLFKDRAMFPSVFRLVVNFHEYIPQNLQEVLTKVLNG